jgi:glutamate racemase
MGRFGNADGEMDCLVLGCTHYAFVAAELTALVGSQINLLEGGAPVARQTRRLLERAQLAVAQFPIANTTATEPMFYSTGDLVLLDSAIRRWLATEPKTQSLSLA